VVEAEPSRYTGGMRMALKRHPDSFGSAATSVEAEAKRRADGTLVLSYFVTGTINQLRLPPVAEATRTDELWQHTCFEAFVCSPPNAGYYEFNFAPSTRWAAYRFSAYRSGMRIATEIGAPQTEIQSGSEHCTLRASLKLDRIDLPADRPWRLGVSAVIEDTSGRKSYWALAHQPGKPDFHRPDCFACELLQT
jgi:hypothetical protein